MVEKTPEQIAEERIEEARRTRATWFSLVELGLTSLLPEEVQATITRYLDAKTSRHDTLASKVEEAVDKLKEYRSALISDTVTGKIDVRNEVTS